MNKEIAQIFAETIKLLEIKGDKALSFKINAYKRAIYIFGNLKVDISEIYKNGGLKAIMELGIGERNAKKIEEYIKRGKIKEFEELNEETAIQNVIAHFFQTKGVGLQELKNNAKKKKIIYIQRTR